MNVERYTFLHCCYAYLAFAIRIVCVFVVALCGAQIVLIDDDCSCYSFIASQNFGAAMNRAQHSDDRLWAVMQMPRMHRISYLHCNCGSSPPRRHTQFEHFFSILNLFFFFLLAYFVLKARSVSKYTSLDSVNHTSNQIQYPNRLFFGLSPESVSDFDRPSVVMNGLDFGGARQRMIAR